MSKFNPLVSDRDSQWKEIIEALFEDLIQFCIPDLHKEIDFSFKPIFLEQELLKIFPDWSKKGKRLIDKLAKVRLKNGEERWILVHIEAQEKADPDFPQRMHIYFYRILDYHKMPVSALAIYTGNSVPKPHNIYKNEFFGTSITYKFNTLCLKDLDEETLKKSSNPFAIAALAGLYTIKTPNNFTRRYAFKKQLARLLMERNYHKDKIVKLFIFIQYIVNLPQKLNSQFIEDVKQQVNSEQMRTNEKINLSTNAEELFEDFIRKAFGTTMQEEKLKIEAAVAKTEAALQRAESERQKAEAEKQKAEAEKQKAEAEKQKAEAEKLKAEAEKLKAEAEKLKAKNERQANIIRLHQIASQPPAQIALLLGLEESYVKQVLIKNGLIS